MKDEQTATGKQRDSTGFTVKEQEYEFTVLHGVGAVKFSPLMGGCLPIGEIKTRKTL